MNYSEVEEKPNGSEKKEDPTITISHNGSSLTIRGNVTDETVIYWMLGKAQQAIMNGGPKEKIVKTIPELMGKAN